MQLALLIGAGICGVLSLIFKERDGQLAGAAVLLVVISLLLPK